MSFRALAYIRDGQCQLVSRRGYVYERFLPLAEQIARSLKARDAVLDGEIVCLDGSGKSQFKSLMYRRGTPYFYAFDILQLNGKDLRSLPLLTRKRQLRRLIPKTGPPSAVRVSRRRTRRGFVPAGLREDLEDIVAKWRDGLYDLNCVSSWFKIQESGLFTDNR